jgi:hypothetical protein
MVDDVDEKNASIETVVASELLKLVKFLNVFHKFRSFVERIHLKLAISALAPSC